MPAPLTLHRVAKLNYALLTNPEEHGFGAARYGGRWNSADPDLTSDRRIIYVSDTLAQALLEVIVHVDAEVLHTVAHGHVRFKVQPAFVAELGPEALPAGWNQHPATSDTQVIGDEWFDTRASVVLRVPSVILPLSVYPDLHSHYLINTLHPQFLAAVEWQGAEPLPFDPRLR
jgi:RES domain-containing protein